MDAFCAIIYKVNSTNFITRCQMLNSLKSGNRLRVDFAKNPQKSKFLTYYNYNKLRMILLMINQKDRSTAGIEKVFKNNFPYS